jgi:hypothetical protein
MKNPMKRPRASNEMDEKSQQESNEKSNEKPRAINEMDEKSHQASNEKSNEKAQGKQ